MLEMLRVICKLTLIVYRTQIDAYKSRTMSLIESGDPVATKCRMCNRFRNVFKNLRGGRETSIV
jgi:hypothetical protein